MVGINETTNPDDVQRAMENLLWWYSNEEKTLKTMIFLHSTYEAIHPFQDGNGRVGRIILFRECITNNIDPFIIRNENKKEYIACLNSAIIGECDRFVEYIKSEQEWFAQTTKGMF